MINNILIYGSKGWIGNQFLDILKKTDLNYTIGNSRVENIVTLKNEINEVKPTHIISFIGRTHGSINGKKYTTIDYLEQDGKLYDNIRDNLFSPLALALISKKLNIHYTYLGTGCIFKFDNEHPFGEEINGFLEKSIPNFFGSSYSIVKGFTDRFMSFFDKNVLTLRIRMPITGEMNSRNFITKITTYDKICSVPNSMTVLPELLPKIIYFMENNITGILNFTNPGLISHNEILEMFKEIVDTNFTWNNFTIEEQRQILACDRSNNYLDTSRLEYFFPNIKNIKDSVKECLIKYKQTYIPKELNISKLDTIPNITIQIEKSNINNIDLLFITGGAGFIGSNFINIFSEKYPNVKIINFDALYYCADENNVNENIRNSEYYTFIHGNLQSFDLLKYIFQNNNISHIIHFAAQSHVQNSFTDSIQYTKDNVLGTHNLLEVCRLYGKNIKKIIHVSTDEVYGESIIDINEKKKNEQSLLCPTNPYAATKAAAESLVMSYYYSFNLPIIISRGNNVYGPNQYPEKVIPRFIKLLNEGKKITIQGDGSCIRAFLHSSDTAYAFEKILFNGKIGEIYNIGCDENMEYSILDIGKKIIKLIKKTDDYDNWIEYIQDRPFNDKRYFISNEKLKKLGWDIKINFDEGLKNLI